ncbi:hypothetical protein ACQJBY_017791 [Aegilops geniculata]
MGDWKRKSIAGGPLPAMGDWKRRSIAGGLPPETPTEIIPGALHLNLDFFYRPGAAGVAFPIDRADQNGGQRRMAVTPPATMAPPSQAQQCQPAGTAPTGGSGLRPGGRRLRIKVPSASQLPPLPENLAYLFTNVEFYSDDDEEAGEDEEGAMLLGSSEEEEDGEAMSSGSSEGEREDGEDMSSGRSEEDEEDGEDMSSGRSEEMGDGEAMSSGRSEEEEAGQEEMEEEAGQDEIEQEAGEEEEAMLSGHNEDDQVDVDAMLYCHEVFLSQREEEEEEPEEVQAMCVRCDSLERLVTLLPCRHASYCERCFAIVERRQGAGRLCAVCWQPYARGHPQSGGLQPKPKKSSK